MRRGATPTRMDDRDRLSRYDGPLPRAISRVAALLFGTERHETWLRPGWWPRYLTVAGLLAAIVLARRPDMVLYPQFWAEDGFIYFRDNLLLGFPRAVLQLYQGFPHSGQRLIATVGGLVPIAAAPRVYTTLAVGIAALSVATFSLPRYRHLVQSDALRIAFCVACVCLPADQEVFATPTNVGWFLGIWLLFASLSTAPCRAASLAGLMACSVLVTFSTPLSSLIGPFWLLRTVDGALRRDRREMVFGATLLVAFALLFVVTRWLGAMDVITAAVPGRGFHRHRVPVAEPRDCALLHRGGLRRPADRARAARDVSPVRSARRDRRRARAPRRRRRCGGTEAPHSVPRLPASHGRRNCVSARCTASVEPGHGKPDDVPLPRRYSVFPISCALLSIVVVLDGIGKRWHRLLAGTAVGLVIALAWWPTFAIAPLPDLHWPLWAARLQAKLDTGNRDPLIIPMNPAVFPIRFDAEAPSHTRDVSEPPASTGTARMR